MIVEKNNIIHPNDLKIINNLIIDKKLSFVFQNNSVPIFKKKDFYFEHCIVQRKETTPPDENRYKSIYYQNFLRIFSYIFSKFKIKEAEIYRAAINLTVNNSRKKCPIHYDHNYEHKQILIYLNDCDENAKTVILNKKNKKLKEITPKKNKGVLFDYLPHYHFFPKKGYRLVMVITFKEKEK
tara:strand:+ start:1023 stop:1568 length:546 start_codon:yes stop_codon:yes gene_type:complete